MGKTLLQLFRCTIICIGLYFAAKGMHASGLPMPEIHAQDAVQAAGLALQDKKSITEVISVFSDTLTESSDTTVSVSGQANVVR